ncbi:MAG: hypothetical protein K0R40_604 [Burkholderiales bacterium]|jgi:hypothetical protein|nr:hypothetical protein [Burkholderiales bacterium]
MKPAFYRPGWILFLVVTISVAMAVFVLHYVQYPYPVWRGLIFQHLLLRQDLIGLALVVAIALAACVPATHQPALALVEAIGRRPWTTGAVAFVALCAGSLYVAHGHALAGDEYLTLMQSRIFAAGHLTGQYPPDLLSWLMPDNYRYRWIMVSVHGDIAATYWPGFALILAPFSYFGVPWACNPLLASLAVVVLSRMSARLAGGPLAGGWASLLALASPGFTGLAISYFSMTAHLLANLVFAWLLLEPTRRRIVAAGLVGSLALLLHQPVPHLLFALPWVVWLCLQREARRNFALLAISYLPGLVAGVAWGALLREMHGFIIAAPFPSDGEWLNRLGNLFWYWTLRSGWVFGAPEHYAIAARIAEQVRLWAWAAPGLPLLAALGWWLNRRNKHLNLLALSLVATVLGYLLVRFDQGYGWGARYVHSAFGALPILAAAAMMRLREIPEAERLRGWAASAAALSLVLATGLRAGQIEDFMSEHLERRPPYAEGARQIVFVEHDPAYYFDWDLVQNDPFLRAPTVMFLSRGRPEDLRLLQSRFPMARQVHDSWRGHVWRVD